MSRRAGLLYTARGFSIGGREGTARSSDGCLDVRLAIPGSGRIGTNPEQLFAAAWSASFESAMRVAADASNITLPAEMAVHAEVDLNLSGELYFLQARLNISVPGLDRETAEALADASYATCAFSKAVRGNVGAAVKVV